MSVNLLAATDEFNDSEVLRSVHSWLRLFVITWLILVALGLAGGVYVASKLSNAATGTVSSGSYNCVHYDIGC
jgi:hypothetical protein